MKTTAWFFSFVRSLSPFRPRTPTEELAAGMRDMDNDTIRRLLDAGADIDVQESKYGWTLLIQAVRERSLNRCTELLERGASIHVRDHYDMTVWDYLDPFYDNTPFYSLFLQYGADVNQYNPYGWTALHRACRFNHRDILVLLLTEGADPHLPVLCGDYKGKTAYDLGVFWRSPDGIRERLRWYTLSIQEVFILASERGIVPVPSYLW